MEIVGNIGKCRAYELENNQVFRWRPTLASPWQTFVVTSAWDGEKMEARPLDSTLTDKFNEEADVEIDNIKYTNL